MMNNVNQSNKTSSSQLKEVMLQALSPEQLSNMTQLQGKYFQVMVGKMLQKSAEANRQVTPEMFLGVYELVTEQLVPTELGL